MGALDSLIKPLATILNIIDDLNETFNNPEIDDEEFSEVIAKTIEQAGPQDEVAGTVVDLVEETILTDLQQEGELTPENVEAVADETEGAAAAVLFGLGLASSVVEALSLGQIDKHSEVVTQAVAALGVEDVTGLELDARMSEGIMPALNAKVDKEHRSKFVDLPDAVEYLLRHKTGDEGWLQGNNIPQEAYARVQSNSPVNPQNAVEEWGVRDDQLPILEEVALEAMEFEELIETPAELGIIVDDDTLDLVLDLAGYPEELKEFLRQVPDEIPRSNRLWQEKTAVEAVVGQLDGLVRDEELTPVEARQLLPEEAGQAKDALEDRFRNVQDLPTGSPSRSQLEGSFARGYTDVETLIERLDRLEFDVDEYDGVVKSTILDELDGDLQEAVALGLVDENTFSNLAAQVGLGEKATQALLRGESLGDITERRLKEEQDLSEAPPSVIQGIGESREQSLAFEGIETLAELADADVETVAEATQVSPETAEGWINLATQALA